MNIFTFFKHMPSIYRLIKPLLFVGIILTSLLSSACTTQLVKKDKLNGYAVLTAGTTNAWRFIIDPTMQRVKIFSIDHQPVDNPYGPVYLKPGTHIIAVGTEEDYSHEKISVSAGDKLELAFMPAKTLKNGGRIYKITKTPAYNNMP